MVAAVPLSRPSPSFATLFGLILVLLTSGCATERFITETDSLLAPGAHGKTYFVMPSNEGVSADDLAFQAYKAQAVRALNFSGYTQVAPEDAELGIMLGYGIGDPQTQTYSVPIFGQTGTTNTGTSTTGTISTYGNTGYINTTTTVQSEPTYGLVGSSTQTRTTYLRYAILSAYDMRSGAQGSDFKEVWRTTVTSTGSSADLRRVFPIMMAAGQQFLGKQTEQRVQQMLKETDTLVQIIKGGPR